MIKHFHLSLTTRTLLQLGAVVGAIILLAAGIAYGLVFRTVEQHELQRMDQFLAVRVSGLEAQIVNIPRDLKLGRTAFLKRYAQPDPPGYLQRWDNLVKKDADGAWRSKPEVIADLDYAAMWVHKAAELDDELKRRVLIMAEVCEKFHAGWAANEQDFYGITSDCRAMVGFSTEPPVWVYEQPADEPVEQDEYASLSTPEANPKRTVQWTGVNTYLDEVIVTAALPVDVNGQHVITLAFDLAADQFVSATQYSELPGMKHLIFRKDGRMIAFPGEMEMVTDIDELWEVDMASSPRAEWRALYAACGKRSETVFAGYDVVTDQHYVGHQINGPGWIYLSTLPRSVLRTLAFEAMLPVLWSALATLLLELVILSLVLRRSIARPVGELVAATQHLAATGAGVTLKVERADELGELAAAFNDMASKVAQRDASLRHEKESLEQRVTARTVELKVALEQQTELAKMKTDFVSLVSHEFRTPLGVIMSASDVLRRYFDRLTSDKRARHLDMIVNSTRNLSSLIDEVLLLGRVEEGRMQFKPEPLDLDLFCRKLCDEILSATRGSSPIQYRALSSLEGAVSDEALLRHILTNLLSNAVKYSEPGAMVEFTARREGVSVIFCVLDRGIGIPLEDQARLFTSFTRASNVGQRQGTGLGLVVVHRCVNFHSGEIALTSEPGKGTVVTVTLPVFTLESKSTTPP